jgi:hypothetical protein
MLDYQDRNERLKALQEKLCYNLKTFGGLGSAETWGAY